MEKNTDLIRIGILGQPCIDELIAPDGTIRSRSLGGIFYSYGALERAIRTSNRRDSFLALTWDSIPDSEILDPFLSKLAHLSEFPIWKSQSLTNRVRLIYSSEADRFELCATILPPLTPNELQEVDFATLDGLFVNMISGYDISLETFEWIREQSNTMQIHLDIHALILGDLSTEIGVGRTPSGVNGWERWLMASDTVQMNELEARWLASPEIRTEEELIASIRASSKQNHWRTKSIIITRAERGANVYDLRTGEEFEIAPPPTEVIETTGSGDVFGAQFLYSLLLSGDTRLAVREAINAASHNTTLVGVDALVNPN